MFQPKGAAGAKALGRACSEGVVICPDGNTAGEEALGLPGKGSLNSTPKSLHFIIDTRYIWKV